MVDMVVLGTENTTFTLVERKTVTVCFLQEPSKRVCSKKIACAIIECFYTFYRMAIYRDIKKKVKAAGM